MFVILWCCLLLVLTLVVLKLAIPYQWRSSRDVALTNKIPGPPMYPFIGNAYLLAGVSRTDVLPTLLKYCKEYYPIFKWQFFGHVHVVLQEINDIEKVLSSSQNISKSYDYRFLKPWLGTGLLTSTGSNWHLRRKLLTPAFHFKILEDCMPVFNHNSAILVDKLWECIDEPFVFINNFITLCTLDIICETAMGLKINSQGGQAVEYVDAVHRISEVFQLRQLTFWLYNDFSFKMSSLGRKERKILKFLHGFSTKIIRERRAEYRANKNSDQKKTQTKRKLAFLDLLIEVSEKEKQLTDIDIREEVDTFMFEGHDTTSAALSWAIFLLGAHPEIQDKAWEELFDIFGDSDRPATAEDLQQMKYLERVIKESLRLYPSVPGVSRQLDTDIELNGYTVPAGTNCPIVTIMVHRNPELWPEPDKFDPDRFLPDAIRHRHPFAYLPFSAGPRNCIGQRFALMEEKVVLSTILRNFRLRSLDDESAIKPCLELITRPDKPLRIHISPRK